MKHHLLICYKNFSKDCNVSHVGLGITANYTATTLRHHGYFAQARAIFGADDLGAYIKSQLTSTTPVTHVVICAQWIPTANLAALAIEYPRVVFALNCHSNISFLQAEPPAVRLLRQAIDLQTGVPNFFASSNNVRLACALKAMFGRPITYLPNLYYLHGKEPIGRPLHRAGTLRIGIFGAHRVYKNFSVAVAASVQIAMELKMQTEIWLNAGRHDGAGNIVINTAKAWTEGLPNVTLKEFHWSSWPEFKRMIGTMNVLMQPSFTETFNNVTSDGVAESVPSVVSTAVEWVPCYWQANTDDSSEVAAVGRRLLTDHYAARDGYESLKAYVAKGLPHWADFLERT